MRADLRCRSHIRNAFISTCKKGRALRPGGPVLDGPQRVLRCRVRLFRGASGGVGDAKLVQHMRTSSFASHGGGGQYTCVTAKADKSITPDQPQADERRAVSKIRQKQRRACRTEMESEAAGVGRVEKQALHLQNTA